MEIEFGFDFSDLNCLELAKFKITHSELKSVFVNSNSKIYPVQGVAYGEFVYFNIGYSEKQRFLCLIYQLIPDISVIKFLETKIALEHEIQSYYCKTNRKSF